MLKNVHEVYDEMYITNDINNPIKKEKTLRHMVVCSVAKKPAHTTS